MVILKPIKNSNKNFTSLEEQVLFHKATERPFSGLYNLHQAKGIYSCKNCDSPLFTSEHKFLSHCGWPSFDDEIKGSIKRLIDSDGHRIEIVCNNCHAHLGHVFEGEGLTMKNIRHCVNSIAMNFQASNN